MRKTKKERSGTWLEAMHRTIFQIILCNCIARWLELLYSKKILCETYSTVLVNSTMLQYCVQYTVL